jgi:predicted transposase/invertase (TIGR01784 family)
MRRDSIFYALFQRNPSLLFELLENAPSSAAQYRFESVVVKEPMFEIDGVFLPPETEELGIVFFCEIQFQKDEQLYERMFGELFLYFYRNRARFSAWQAVVIYPSRTLEQANVLPYQVLLSSDQVHRIYLDELGEIDQLPLGVAVMVLTTLQDNQAAAAARNLLARSDQELAVEASRAIIEMITTIMVYRFTTLSRREVEAMLGVTLQQTRVYQEAKEEGDKRGKLRGLERERALVLRQLTRRVGKVPDALRHRVEKLSVTQLEDLGEALLDFAKLADLKAWLQQLPKEE